MAQLFSMDTCSDCQLQATVLAPDDTVEDADLFNKLARMEVHAVVDGRRLERQAGASQPCSRYLLPPSLPPPIPPPPSFAHRKPSSPHTAGPGRGYWEQRARVSSPAHNPKPKAPEHVGLLNNLAAEDPHRHEAKTHLPTDIAAWDELSAHIKQLAAPLTRCVDAAPAPELRRPVSPPISLSGAAFSAAC